MIYLPQITYDEFIGSLKEGKVSIHNVGTFHVTKYIKKTHPTFVTSPKKKRFVKNKKCSKIGFKPHLNLKKSVK